MKTKFLLVSILSLSIYLPLKSQTIAVTESGDTIFVYNDGTWSFTDDSESGEVVNKIGFLSRDIKIDTISTPFEVSSTANKTITSTIFEDFEFRYNDKKWKRQPPGQYNKEAEFAFSSKTKDIFCVAITEEVEVGMENLLKIAIHTMEENTGAKVNLIKSELRKINGTDVIHGVLQMQASGLNFVFDSYYFSDERGSIQLTTWTGENVHEKYKSEIEELLNGFILK